MAKILSVKIAESGVNRLEALIRELAHEFYSLEYSNNADFWESITSNAPDVIFLHIDKDPEKAINICLKIRRETDLTGTAVVGVMAANSPQSIRKSACAAGFNLFVYKPLNIHDVKMVLDVLLKNKQLNEWSEQKLQYGLILRALIDNLPDAVYIKDRRGRKLAANSADLKIIGAKSEAEVLGKTDLEIFKNEHDRYGFYQDMKIMDSGKPLLNYEDYFEDKEGNPVWRVISKIPVRDENGNISGLVGFGRDITLRKFAEIELQKASANWSRTFHSIRDGIALIDLEQKIIQYNEAFTRFVQSDVEDLLGKKCIEVIHHSECPHDDCPFQRMLKSHKRESLELAIRDMVCEIVVDPIFDHHNRLSGAVHIISDISQRKYNEKVQQVLFEIEKKSMAVKAIEEILLTVREELGKIIDTENFFVALYNAEKNSFRRLVFFDEKEDPLEWDAAKSLSGQVLKLKHALLLNAGESETYIKQHKLTPEGAPAKCWLGVPLIYGNEVVGVMVVQSYTREHAYDNNSIRLLEMVAHELSIVLERTQMIQDLILAKEKAEESDRLKSAFLANVSHEIRTPMNGILGFLELLSEPELTSDKREHYLDIVNKSGQRLLTTINDIVEISRIESEQIEFNPGEVNVEELMLYHFDFFRKQADDKGLRLELKEIVRGNSAIIISDIHKIEGVLTNLLNNAIKYTASGNIWFGNYIEGENLVFYVKDTGAGIPADKLESVFERFIQSDLNITRPQEGSGLGLAIVKAYIDMMKGRIWLESEVERGSAFYFSLPLK